MYSMYTVENRQVVMETVKDGITHTHSLHTQMYTPNREKPLICVEENDPYRSTHSLSEAASKQRAWGCGGWCRVVVGSSVVVVQGGGG